MIPGPLYEGAGTPKGVTGGVSCRLMHTPSVKNQRFLPPPSKREARAQLRRIIYQEKSL